MPAASFTTEARGVGRSASWAQCAPASDVVTNAVQVLPAQGTAPSTNPVRGDTNVTDAGWNPAGTRVPLGVGLVDAADCDGDCAGTGDDALDAALVELAGVDTAWLVDDAAGVVDMTGAADGRWCPLEHAPTNASAAHMAATKAPRTREAPENRGAATTASSTTDGASAPLPNRLATRVRVVHA